MFMPGMSGILLDTLARVAIPSAQFGPPSIEYSPSLNAMTFSIRRNVRDDAVRRTMTKNLDARASKTNPRVSPSV
jgi:hypothetical protein